METPATIQEIREYRDSITEKINKLNFKDYKNEYYGQEEEYSFERMIQEITSFLSYLSVLIQHSNKFISLFSYSERKVIRHLLQEINDNLEDDGYLVMVSLEELKKIIRVQYVHNLNDTKIEFENEINNFRELKIELQNIINDFTNLNKSIKDKHENTNKYLIKNQEELKKIIDIKNGIITQSKSLEEINTNLNTIREKAKTNLDEITDSLNESKSNEKLINSFAGKVQNRENRFDKLDKNIQNSNKAIEEYQKERTSFLDEANSLIESAKKALNYKTAEGISDAFSSQYDKANDSSILKGWLIGAIASLIITIGLGVWVTYGKDTSIAMIIGRISLLPLPIIGTIFCGRQYTKQKSIIEDYAYKMVISKAIVGFSEQLKKNGSESNEEYINYIQKALEEIHKDPQRKRDEKKKENGKELPLKEFVEVAEKIMKIAKD